MEQPIETAPRGDALTTITVTVWHGPRTRQEAVRAYWNARLQGWVRDGDLGRCGGMRVLQNVRWWIPEGENNG